MRPIFVASAALIAAGGLYLLTDGSPPNHGITTNPLQDRQLDGSTSSLAKASESPQTRGLHTEERLPDAEEGARIRALLLATGPLQRGQIKNEEAIALLHRLVEIDPAGAILIAVEQEAIHGDHALPGELFTSWFERFPAEAEQWFIALPVGDLRSRVAPEYISLLAFETPERALAVLESLTGEARTRSLTGLFTEWSEHDPRAAAAYALQLNRGTEERGLALMSIAEKWAQMDLQSAIVWLSQLPWGGDREAVLSGLLPEWAARYPAQAAGLGGAIPENSPIRGEWLRAVAEHWGAQDPEAAMRWIQGLGKESDRSTAMRAVVAAFAEAGNASAAAQLMKLPPGGLRQEALEVLMNRWAAADMNAVADWCVALPPGQLRDALGAFGPIWATREPQSLAPLLGQVLDQGLREKLANAVAEAWVLRQPTAASQWALTALSGQERVQALRRIVPAWANRDLKAVGDWVNGMDSGSDRDFTVELLSDYLAPKYPEAAAEWANSITDEGQREAQMQSLFELWVGRDPEAARKWFGDRVVKP